MRNFKNLMLLSGMSAALVVTTLTGCKTSSSHGDERSEGRMVDDKKITSNIKTSLKNEPVYKFTDVDVRTFDGIVQLSGFVSSDDQKRRAGEIAQNVPGVTQVHNNISMKPQPPSAPTGRTNAPVQAPTTTERGTNDVNRTESNP